MDNYYKPQMFDMNTMEFKNFVQMLESTKKDDDKEVHHIQKGSPESGTTSTKSPILRCNRCCDKVRIHSSNAATEFYPHLLGIYEVLDKSADCYPPTYK